MFILSIHSFAGSAAEAANANFIATYDDLPTAQKVAAQFNHNAGDMYAFVRPVDLHNPTLADIITELDAD